MEGFQDLSQPEKSGLEAPWIKHRTAVASIVNQTTEAIASVSLIHKFSDNCLDHYIWSGVLKPGEAVSPAGKVRYHTGAGSTGLDWWRVTWVNAEKQMVATAPQNFQEIFNWVEGFLKDNASWAELKLMQSLPESGEAAPFVAAAAGAIKAADAMILNKETTVGFKEYMLEAGDDGATVTLTIGADGQVAFTSPSGSESTPWKVVNDADD
ncbi:hypothetical protein [Paracoccus salsus]|uniref:hypothetical protein n=1 Tax=Paracoccus salsus TaxID=2911061 RepID=UPI001F363612